MTAVLPAVIEDARRRQRRRRVWVALLAVAAAVAAGFMTGFPFGGGGGPSVPSLSRASGEGASNRPAPTGGLVPGFHVASYAKAIALGLPGVTRYDRQDDPAKCVPNSHWSCTGSAMYCPRKYTGGGYTSAAALDRAIKRAPKNAVCTTDPRDVGYGYGTGGHFYHPLESTAISGNRLRYHDPNFGWTITYPRIFPARAFALRGFETTDQGVSIANFSPPPDAGFRTEYGQPVKIPADGVVFQLDHFDGPIRGSGGPEARFPLRLGDFTTTPAGRGSAVKTRTYQFSADGLGLQATVAIGPNVTAGNRQALAAIVSSLAFPDSSTSTMRNGYYVLEQASAYPIGSVTRVDPETTAVGKQNRLEPFYLVHDAEGFRAVGWPHNMFPHYKAPCNVRYDPKHQQLYCPHGQRWDLRGRDFAHFHQASLYRPLYLYATDISGDGHVLVSENSWSSPH